MAIGLENNPNNDAVTAAYPYGGIKDNDGSGNGTPINKLTNDDIHQTLRKLLDLANIAPNGLPDNVTNGFQYIDAMYYLFRTITGTVAVSASMNITKTEIRKLISVEGTSGSVDLTMLSSFSNFIDGDSFIIRNNSNDLVRVLRTAPDTFEINGLAAIAPIELPANGDFIELVLEKSTNTWRAINFKQTEAPPTYPWITVTPSANFTIPATVLGEPNVCEYRINSNNEVEYRGLLKCVSGGASLTVLNAPISTRVSRAMRFVADSIIDGSVFLRYDVSSSDFIATLTVNTHISLEQLKYSLDV